MAFDEIGFGGMFDLMNPQGNPLELGSMLAHQPEGVIPQLVAEGITPGMFESRFPQMMGLNPGGITSGQLLNTASQGGFPVLSGPPGQSPGLAGVPDSPLSSNQIVPKPVQTLSIRPPEGPPPVPAATPPGYTEQPAPDTTAPTTAPSPAPGAEPPTTTANPAGMDAKAQADKKIADLQKLLAGVRAPPAPVVQMPRPGTAGPPALRPINPQSAITALLQQALGGGRVGPGLGSVIRR